MVNVEVNKRYKIFLNTNFLDRPMQYEGTIKQLIVVDKKIIEIIIIDKTGKEVSIPERSVLVTEEVAQIG